MRTICLWILAGFIVWPVGSTVMTVSNKPIDLILSDLLFGLVPLFYLGIRSRLPSGQAKTANRQKRWFSLPLYCAVLCIIYMTSLAGIGLGMSEEWVRVYSAFKLTKPIALILVGFVMGGWTDPFDFIDILGKAFGVLVALTLFFTVTDPDFPLGEWGRFLFEWELGGYPNSAMSFFAVMVPLLLAVADTTRIYPLRIVAWCLAAGAAMTILGSMSRSSSVVLLIGTTLYLARTGRGTLLAGTGGAIAVCSIVGFGVFSSLQDTEAVSTLVNRVKMRVDRSTGEDDPSSGRFEIWQFALELSMEKPTFGYMFESFSRYAGNVDTPHQQYLEILYKCGGVGLSLYLALLASCWMAVRRLLLICTRGDTAWYRLHSLSAMLIGVLIGNLTQPNLTYSLTGNMLFFVFGLLCSERAALSAQNPCETPQPVIVGPGFVPRPRVAA